MKRFWEYDVTEDEMRRWWRRGREAYDSWVDMFKDDPEPSDTEKNEIAMLCCDRGDMTGAYEVARSIEDKSYREDTLCLLRKHEAETANPWVCVD